MDRYKASIESVDSALNRLNQTLASYKLLVSDPANSSTPAAPAGSNAAVQKPTHIRSDAVQEPRSDHLEQSNGIRASSDAVSQASIRPESVSDPEERLVDDLLRNLRSSQRYPEQDASGSFRLRRLQITTIRVEDYPYCLPLYLILAVDFLGLGYPDLAAGAAYKALLLSDALDNEAEEYHDEASASLKEVIQMQPLEERIAIIRKAMDAELKNTTPTELDPTLDVELTLWLKTHYRLVMYRLFTRALLLCGCLRSALSHYRQAIKLYPGDQELGDICAYIVKQGDKLGIPRPESISTPLHDWPDSGFVRREIYPWNELEPDRLNMLDELNELMGFVSDKLEVRVVGLPVLTSDGDGVSQQLGVFAKEDISPGEEILNETSILTANNKLQDALCDACSTDLPALNSPEGASVVSCPDCEVVFCSEWCYTQASESYHLAFCGKDVEAIAKDVPPAEAADSLYSLLLLRALALGKSQNLNPLQIPEVKYIWGDFTPTPPPDQIIYTDLNSPDACTVPRTLPFSFEYNIRLPFHMLERMDIDIFADPHHDVWVFNTLLAKFRGTASARLSGLGGRAIRGPEVSAVHPMWCLANHSCDPNVSWEWGGSIRFWARGERIPWIGKEGEKRVVSEAGIKKGEEILNHYCDVELPVKERREWARGALGGDCQCPRCRWEAAAAQQQEEEEVSK
ncbi:related to MYND domain [Lecanosticta acicola]|uniref:Related to MYND domain n=1 Tax=Lecanosticta acicola TaxID=111012 RepID=A0AAI9EDZ8_9PEZI|nr:related to MYND domain [Lecanosticta acicola]